MKSYAAVFVCCVTKAVHIELVHSVDTNDFIAALKRFVARRGIVHNIYSDNGTNFVGAYNELRKIHQQHKKDYSHISNAFSEGVNWHFIPANSPHFRGLWEAAVKSLKHHLRKIIGNAILSFNELYTLLLQIEAILNSRPLTSLSSDPNDLEFVSLGHFLIGSTLTSLPEVDIYDVPSNRLARWKGVEQLRQHLWSRWQREYLPRYQERFKWKSSQSEAATVGRLVVIRDDNLPPNKKMMGRIIAVHPGTDGIVRVATLKTFLGSIKRAVSRLCVLPIETEQKL